MIKFKEILLNSRTLAEIVIVIISIVSMVSFVKEKENFIQNLIQDKKVLEEKLSSQIEINKNSVTFKRRDGDKVITSNVYVPKEGNVKVNTYKDPKDAGKTSIIDKLTTDKIQVSSTTVIVIKKAGLCFKPALAGVTDLSQGYIGLEARFLYYKRYGMGLGITEKSPYLFIDRRIDDVFSFIQNTMIGIVYGQEISGLKLSVQF